MLSAILDPRSHSIFRSPMLLSLSVQYKKKSQRASLGISISVQIHPILIHKNEPSQTNRTISLSAEAWATDIISYIPLNLWLLVICITTILKGSKGKYVIVKHWIMLTTERILGLPLNVYENAFSLCILHIETQGMGKASVIFFFLSTQGSETLQCICCPPHHCL